MAIVFDDEIPQKPKSRIVFDDEAPQTSQPYATRDMVGDIARPLLEGGAAVAGGVLGAPLGPVGAAGGGALGYGIGKGAADLLDRGLGRKEPITGLPQAVNETGENLMAGATAEATGQVAGRVVPSLLKNVGKFGAKLGEWATAVPEKDFKVVAENPASMWPGSLEKAGKNFDAAATKAGISSELTPEAVDRMRQPGQYAFDTFNKLKTQGSITPQEALHARQSVDAVYPIPNKKNGSYIRMLDQIRDAFQEVISTASPELQKASKDYAIAKSGSKFQSLFPRTNAGKPAFFRTGAIVGSVMSGRPEALFGIPAVAGTTTALIGKPGKAVGSIFKNADARRLLASPLRKTGAKILGEPRMVDGSPEMQQPPEDQNSGSPKFQVVDSSLQHPESLPRKTPLSKAKAREFLDQANGDRDLARKLAKKAGYSW